MVTNEKRERCDVRPTSTERFHFQKKTSNNKKQQRRDNDDSYKETKEQSLALSLNTAFLSTAANGLYDSEQLSSQDTIAKFVDTFVSKDFDPVSQVLSSTCNLFLGLDNGLNMRHIPSHNDLIRQSDMWQHGNINNYKYLKTQNTILQK